MKNNLWSVFRIGLCLFISVSVKAERLDTTDRKVFSNSIKFSRGGFAIPEFRPFFRVGYQRELADIYRKILFMRGTQYVTIGGYYERKVYRNWFVGAGYTQWKDLFGVEMAGDIFYVNVRKDKPIEIGDLQYRVNYKMADVYAFYKWGISKNKRHYINAGIGASYCWGHNEIVRNYWLNPQPPQDAVTVLDIVKAEYWGVVPYLAYDFWFFKNRINIGPDIRARFYSGRSPAEYNYNLHLGVNF